MIAPDTVPVEQKYQEPLCTQYLSSYSPNLPPTITAGIMILIKIISFHDAKKFIDFDVLVVIASAFGIGKAIENSGIADLIATNLINSLEFAGIIGIIAGLFFITNIYILIFFRQSL